MLSTLEGYDFTVVDGERRSAPIQGWSVAKARRAGADAIKVLAWHRPDVSEATAAHQDAFVRAAAAACVEQDVPFVLELLDYPLPGEDPRDPAWLQGKPDRVLGSLRHYADPAFGVDLFKLELPFDVHYVREVAAGALDGVARDPIWSQAEADALLAEVDGASRDGRRPDHAGLHGVLASRGCSAARVEVSDNDRHGPIQLRVTVA